MDTRIRPDISTLVYYVYVSVRACVLFITVSTGHAGTINLYRLCYSFKCEIVVRRLDFHHVRTRLSTCIIFRNTVREIGLDRISWNEMKWDLIGWDGI